MMIKVLNEFLEFDGDIEVEKQIKLFEEIETTDGDFSYSFEITKTLNNTRILGNPMPDNISNLVYQKIEAVLMGDSGAETYKGYIRLERITENKYQCSFFAGNNNWFGLLSGPLSDIDFSEFDTPLNYATIIDLRFATEGIVMPLIDNGALNTRGAAQLVEHDFIAGIFVKTVFNKIFNFHGIKIQGELLSDANFQSAITLSNGKSQADIDAASSFVENNIGQSRASENTLYKLTFQNDSVYPYYDGSLNAFDLPNSRWIAPFKTEIQIEVGYTYLSSVVQISRIEIWINGVFSNVDIGIPGGGLYHFQALHAAGQSVFSIARRFTVNENDVIEIYTLWDHPLGSNEEDLLSAFLKITPLYIFKSFGNKTLPDWTQQQYVSSVLACFNTLTHYNAASKTLTFNLFEKINAKPSIDLSDYIQDTEIDYSEFISNYGKVNLLSHKELQQDEDFRNTRFEYATGEIHVNNDFLESEVDIIESEFSNPTTYINEVFGGMSIDRTNLIEIEIDPSTNATAVTDSSGTARFAIQDHIFQLSDMVRVEESTNHDYNGDWLVSAIGTTWVELQGVFFSTDAQAKLGKINFKYTESDDVFLLHYVPFYSVTKFSSVGSFKLGIFNVGNFAFSFFSIINTGRQVNKDFLYSMSFANYDSELQYQISMTDQYFKLFSKILNDPVKLFCTAHLPYDVYDRIYFLSPIQIKTIETTNQYYLNRITGYKESYLPCVIELIKL
jgi:hypothetical protein